MGVCVCVLGEGGGISILEMRTRILSEERPNRYTRKERFVQGNDAKSIPGASGRGARRKSKSDGGDSFRSAGGRTGKRPEHECR